jgi:hypothetical protein
VSKGYPAANKGPNLAGRRFGRLVVLRESDKTGDGERRWACSCDCGGLKTTRQRLLLVGKTESCGCLQREARLRNRGESHYAWKGDAAQPITKRQRAQKMYALGACDGCGKPATDRHHKDGDTGNNVASNIGLLCRRCHMTEDGRLESLRALGRANGEKRRLPPRPCSRCAKLVTVFWYGECGACNEYRRRNGASRPQHVIDAWRAKQQTRVIKLYEEQEG